MIHVFRSAIATLAVATILTSAERSAAQNIDLLRAVRTDLAVSSVYRDRLAQAAALVDGDLETAWNSRTGDLRGAWIEVRLPANATVTSIALTAGYTKQSGARDLFTGNHRISRVRVLRDGRDVGVYDLRTDLRELQTLPVTGPGGVYRIEVVDVVPGSRSGWREVCVSELRILGNAPGARPGERFPRLAVRQLPEPRPEPGTASRDEVRRALRDATLRFGREWGALIDEEGTRRSACFHDEEDAREVTALLSRRQRFLTQLAGLVELVDEMRADRLRASAYLHSPHGDASFLGPRDHQDIADGFHAVLDALADDTFRCRFATADAELRLRRVEDELQSLNHVCEHLPMDYPDESEPPPREEVRRCNLVERALERVQDIVRLADQLRTAAAHVRRYDPPRELSERLNAEWQGLEAALDLASESCRWGEGAR